MNFIAGREDATKWILQFWRGTYTGTYSDGLPYGDITQENSDPELVLESPEFKNMQELVDWAQNDSNFALAFVLDSTTNVEGNGEITEGDITTALMVSLIFWRQEVQKVSTWTTLTLYWTRL